MTSETIYSIYKITNTITNKVYIGYSMDYLTRWVAHKSKSKKPKIKTKLYNSVKHYGWEYFTFDVLYQTKNGLGNFLDNDSHILKVMETHFINEYDSLVNGYNMTSGGENPPHKVSKFLVIDKLGNKFITKNLRKFSVENGMKYQGLLVVSRGIAQHSNGNLCFNIKEIPEDDLQKFIDSKEAYNIRTYLISDPDGNFCTETSMLRYEKNNKLPKGTVSGSLLFGRSRLGYMCYDITKSTPDEVLRIKSKDHRHVNRDKLPDYLVIDTRGNQHLVKNLSGFCRDRKLTQSAMIGVMNGLYKNSKGHLCYDIRHLNSDEDIKEFSMDKFAYITRKYLITTPSGDVIEIDNLSKFCKKNNLIQTCFHKVLSGTKNNLKGFLVTESTHMTKLEIEHLIKNAKPFVDNSTLYEIRSPDGGITVTGSIKKYCKENGLHSGSMFSLVKNKSKTYRGYSVTKIRPTPN